MLPARPVKLANAVHSTVYRHECEFNSHPFLGGFWRTVEGDLLVAFMSAANRYGSAEEVSHNSVNASRRRMRLIRSRDGGASWDVDGIQTLYETPEPENAPPEPAAEPLPNTGEVLARPWLRFSTDGGHSWRPVIRPPMHKLASLSGNGSVTRRSDGLWLAAFSAASQDGWYRRPVLYGSWDGVSWAFLSFITPPVRDDEVDGPREGLPRFGAHRTMYPRAIQLRDGRIIVSVRAQRDPTSVLWTEIYESSDGGRTFGFLSRVNDWGAPGDIIELRDGRIACVYGYRLPGYGIRCRLSADGGASWGREYILRDDGGSWDLGYPRVIEDADGTLLAVYYFNRADDPVQVNGGVRHIAMTRFDPDAVQSAT
jgi:hypothetical protein